MKLLFENWRKYLKENVEIDEEAIKASILSLLPHAKIRGMKLIGSSAMDPEDRARQDIEKHGEEQEERDIDIKVHVSGITPVEVEEWAFSEEAEELETLYNYVPRQINYKEITFNTITEALIRRINKYRRYLPLKYQ